MSGQLVTQKLKQKDGTIVEFKARLYSAVSDVPPVQETSTSGIEPNISNDITGRDYTGLDDSPVDDVADLD